MPFINIYSRMGEGRKWKQDVKMCPSFHKQSDKQQHLSKQCKIVLQALSFLSLTPFPSSDPHHFTRLSQSRKTAATASICRADQEGSHQNPFLQHSSALAVLTSGPGSLPRGGVTAKRTALWCEGQCASYASLVTDVTQCWFLHCIYQRKQAVFIRTWVIGLYR